MTIAAILNLVGAFLSVEVATTVAKGILNLPDNPADLANEVGGTEVALTIISAGLVGAILFNILTWLLGLPSSSSHALFGGLIGSGLAASVGINWNGIVGKVIVPALLAPVIACIVASVGTMLIYAITKRISESRKESGFRHGQIASASLVSLAHGTGDAQKTMGVIALALIVTGHLDPHVAEEGLPVWVIASCAIAIALGTYLGGWRIIRTLGKGLVEISAPQGMAAEASSAAIILTSSVAGMALSTTHVATGSILGSGLGKKGAEVRWGVAGRMAVAWVTTLPAAAIVGALAYWLASAIGGLAGALTIFVILAAASLWMWFRAQKQKVDASNVNADWDDSTNSPVPAEVRVDTEPKQQA